MVSVIAAPATARLLPPNPVLTQSRVSMQCTSPRRYQAADEPHQATACGMTCQRCEAENQHGLVFCRQLWFFPYLHFFQLGTGKVKDREHKQVRESAWLGPSHRAPTVCKGERGCSQLRCHRRDTGGQAAVYTFAVSGGLTGGHPCHL